MAGSQRWAWLKPSQPAATTQINPGWLWKLPLNHSIQGPDIVDGLAIYREDHVAHFKSDAGKQS
jgi:hypothetical protein